MFLLRPARDDDLEALLALAHLLDSPNLPRDPGRLRERLARSRRAFAEKGPPAPGREYQLALEDASGRVGGTSAILAKHGTPEQPHVFLRVRNEERRARSLGVAVQHRTLQLEAEPDGPSELGALVLDPRLRSRPGWPGKLLSWGRFAFIARHPECFEDRLLAEMRPSFDAEGRQAFWQAFGARFTGMSYEEADRRSVSDKSFILELFPSTPFYDSLLDEEAAAQLGQVHEEARPALRLLERAGLHWIGEIDPFDAGPYFGAEVSEVIPVRETRRLRAEPGPEPAHARAWIASTEAGGEFRAVATRGEAAGDRARLPEEACARLGVGPGDEVALTPLGPRGPSRA